MSDAIPQGRFITAARKALRMSRADLGAAAGVSTSMLSDYETGKRKPTRNNRRAVLGALEARGITFLIEHGEMVGLRWPE